MTTCPVCSKVLADDQALRSHVRMKHGRGAERLHLGRKPKRPQEESVADIAIEVSIARLGGEPVPKALDDMFPE